MKPPRGMVLERAASRSCRFRRPSPSLSYCGTSSCSRFAPPKPCPGKPGKPCAARTRGDIRIGASARSAWLDNNPSHPATMTAPTSAMTVIRICMVLKASVVVVFGDPLQADALYAFRRIQRAQQGVRGGHVAKRRPERRVYGESLARSGQRHQPPVADMKIQSRPDDDLWIMTDSDPDLKLEWLGSGWGDDLRIALFHCKRGYGHHSDSGDRQPGIPGANRHADADREDHERR